VDKLDRNVTCIPPGYIFFRCHDL